MRYEHIESVEAFADSPAWQFVRAFGFTILIASFALRILRKKARRE